MTPGAVLAAALLTGAPEVSPARLLYRAEIAPEPRLRVEVRLPAAASSCPRTLVMPRAVPMGYGEQPYDRFVMQVRAFGRDGAALAVKREEGPRWTLCASGNLDRLEYEIDLAGMEDSILAGDATSRWRDGYVSLLGYSVFAFVEGLEDLPVRLEIAGPADWPLLSTLSPRVPAPPGRVSAEAPNFYALADSQVVGGPKATLRVLRAASPPVFSSLYSEAEGPVDGEALGKLVLEGFDLVAAYFDSVPFDHYTVLQEYLRPRSRNHQYGLSMEHLESATFSLAASQALAPAAEETTRLRTLYNFAHHIAHAWIPKRCYGPGYFPFSWELAPLLDSIWFSEGFAQYAALDALAGRLPPAEAAAFRERGVERRFRQGLAEAPAFLARMPLVELSYVASTRYGEDFRTGRTVFARGGLMAAEMDQEIRRATGGRKGLRDALRALVAWSAREKRPFRIGELPDRFREATGVEVRPIYERWLGPR